MSGFKPDGFPSISPYLIVSDAGATLAFLEAGLGATQGRWHTRPDGSVMHGEANLHDGVIMLGEMKGAEGGSHVHIYVPDVDAAHTRMVAAGGQSIQEPVQKDGDEDKRGGVRGPCGHLWWVATQT